jgi:adenylosuccinate synthase
MRVARIEDVLQGKVWAYADKTRRKSKRQKDLADIFRIVEKFPQLEETLPQSLREELNK